MGLILRRQQGQTHSRFCLPSTTNLLLLHFFNVKERMFCYLYCSCVDPTGTKSWLFFFIDYVHHLCPKPYRNGHTFLRFWYSTNEKMAEATPFFFFFLLDFILFLHCLLRIWALKMVSGDSSNTDRFCEYGLLRGADRTSWSMLCCGGAEEESSGPPASQYTAPPRGSTYGGGGGNIFIFVILFFMQYISSARLWMMICSNHGWMQEVVEESLGVLQGVPHRKCCRLRYPLFHWKS